LPSTKAEKFICDIFSNTSANKTIKIQTHQEFLFVEGCFAEVELAGMQFCFERMLDFLTNM